MGLGMTHTHGAWLDNGPDNGKPERIAGGTEEWCGQVLAARLRITPERTGYVRPLTEDELR